MRDGGRNAADDAREIVRFYRHEGGEALARRFAAALRGGLDHIRTAPASGSPKYRPDTGIEDLRVWPVKGFPYLIFYRFDGQQVVILRVLHSARDVPGTLRGA